MDRLNKIILSFALAFFCLFASISLSAEIFTNSYSFVNDINFGVTPTYTNTLSGLSLGYTDLQVNTILQDYAKGLSSDSTFKSDDFNNIVSLLINGFNTKYTENFDSYFFIGSSAGNPSYLYLFNADDVDLIGDVTDSTNIIGFSLVTGSNFVKFNVNSKSASTKVGINYYENVIANNGYLYVYNSGFSSNPWSTDLSVKLLQSYSSEYDSSTGKYIYTVLWDGESYYYKAPAIEEPDTPSLPSNAEIARAVQAFYNSDYYKNNKDFSDFIVLYNYDTQYFSFIGHNFGIDLGQVIVPPDYEYDGYSYSQDWWKFFLRNISSEIASNLWNKYYWLYSTNDFGENIISDGKGSIKDLINLHFSTKSIIVYSTTDYPVVKIETDEDGVLTPVEGIVPGDQYTYDENLDPTTNEYNPLENFVPTNPSQTILGDVDFDEINKTFEENKDILNIEGASWLFTANNQLINYFIGFLSLLIVFLIISRILGG